MHAGMVGLVLLTYFVSGGLTQLIGGVIHEADFGVVTLASFVVSAVLSVVVFGVLTAFRGRAVVAPAGRPGQALGVLGAAMLAAAVLGAWISTELVRQQRDSLAGKAETPNSEPARAQEKANSSAAMAPKTSDEIREARAAALTALAFPMQSPFSPQQVCRATIGAIMGRNPEIISAYRAEAETETVYVTYIRPNDRTRWTQRCRFAGQRVIWAADGGRWRTELWDEVITFSSTPDTLTIRQVSADGESSSKTFTRSQLEN
jgi:hypothetical protein